MDCTKVCDRYVSVACHKFDSPPYVCNNCKDKKLCNKDKYIYSAKFADAAVTRRRLESRQGVRLADEKKEELDELVTRLVKKAFITVIQWLHGKKGVSRRIMNLFVMPCQKEKA